MPKNQLENEKEVDRVVTNLKKLKFGGNHVGIS